MIVKSLMTVHCINGFLGFFLASWTACWFRFGSSSLFGLRVHLLSAFSRRLIHWILAGIVVPLMLLTMRGQNLCQLISGRKLTRSFRSLSFILSGLSQSLLSDLLYHLLWYLFGFPCWFLSLRHGLIRGLMILISDWFQTILNLLLIRWCLFCQIQILY